MFKDTPELISSLSNPRIKQVRALRGRKARQENDLFVVEGLHHIGEAVDAAAAGRGVQIEAIYYAPELLQNDFGQRLVTEQTRLGVPVYPTTRQVFTSMADKDNPQGLLALVRLDQTPLAKFTPSNFPWGVALLSPQDPGNLGSILRTVDAVGASGLILLENSVDPTHPSAVRASMGTLFWYPVIRASFAEFSSWSRTSGYSVYGTSAHGSQGYQEVTSYPQPCILLMGSERQGLSAEHIAACDTLLRLPMRGRASSLNLAVATGVLLYAMLEKLA